MKRLRWAAASASSRSNNPRTLHPARSSFLPQKELIMDLKNFIKAVPDFPKKGILFRDVTPLLYSPKAFAETTEQFATEWRGKIDAIAALDARGFIFGTALAIRLALPLVIVRKKGKLPGETEAISYGLEYGKDTLEVQKGAVTPGMTVLVVDDLLATGGTAKAACELIEKIGGKVVGCAFVVELEGLGGREALADYPIQKLLSY